MNKVKKWTLGIAAATFLLAALIVGILIDLYISGSEEKSRMTAD
jgi:hypothetical protein